MFNDTEKLIGKKLIENSSLSDDKLVLTFKTENSTIRWIAEGDCCSESWVEHFDSIPAGEIIRDIVTKELIALQDAGYDPDSGNYNHAIVQYFYEIITNKGMYSIEMRNESNGYYGGYFTVEEE